MLNNTDGLNCICDLSLNITLCQMTLNFTSFSLINISLGVPLYFKFSLQLGTSAYTKIKLIEELRVNKNKIFIIPESGYYIKNDIKKNDMITFLYAGRHVYEKGLFHLIVAFKKLIDKGYKAKLILCGEGVITNYLKKFSEENGLKKFVDFKGYVKEEELKKYFEISDIIVYPSIKMKNWEEQFGYSVLEGMSNGLAAIVTDCGSLPELVSNAGIIVPQKDVEKLAEAMEYLVRNREKLNEYKKMSLERAKEFSLENVAEKWRKLIKLAAK